MGRAVIHHIEFCLDEIEAEIDAQGSLGLLSTQKEYLRQHITAMRCMLTDWQQQPNTAILGSPIPNNEVSVSRDDLTLICGIDSDTAAKLKATGIDQYEVIANWMAVEIRAFCSFQESLSAEQISSENWVEQAAILASGNLTHYAQRVKRGEYNCLTPILALQTEDSTARTAPEEHEALLEIKEGFLDELPREVVPIEAASNIMSDDIAEVHLAVIEAAADPALSGVQGNVVSLASRNLRRPRRPRVQVAVSLLLLAAVSIAVHGWQLQTFSALARSLSP